MVFQHLPSTVLQDCHIDVVVCLADPNPVAEEPEGLWRVSSPPDSGDRRHPGVRPARHVLSFHQLDQLPLGEHGVLQIETRKLSLARRNALRQALDQAGVPELVKDPVVQGTVILELQCAERVCDTLDGVGDAVSEVVHGIDTPLVSRHDVGRLPDAVQGRISHVDVGACHVDLRTHDILAILKLSVPHPLKQVQALVHRPVPVRRILAGLS
eukprot:757379-Hanusia_phi.AAC.17